MIPNVSEISDQMKRCVEFSQSSKSYIKSYEKKIELLKKDTIQCLRVSDYNTTGLREKNFEALVKGNGISEKSNSMAGGSKGLCKKVMTLFLVCVAYRLDRIMGTTYLRDAVVITFCTNEVLSIIENAGLMGIPMPKALCKAVDILAEKGDKED